MYIHKKLRDFLLNIEIFSFIFKYGYKTLCLRWNMIEERTSLGTFLQWPGFLGDVPKEWC